MKIAKPLQLQRCVLLNRFYKLGFRGRTAFYNVCKSLDATLNGLEIISFYDFGNTNQSLINRLNAVIDCLENE